MEQAMAVRNAAPGRTGGDATSRIAHLRSRVEQVQGRRLGASVLPVHPALADLLPGGGLRAGSAYTIGPSTSLLLALLARPSQDGSWCAAVGMPDLGIEAASQLGVDLSRLVLIPDPGERWLAVTAAVADVLPVVATRPPGRVSEGEASRLAARLRDRGTVLLVQGVWPQAEASLSIGAPEWSGLGAGHGYLTERVLTVTVESRRSPVPRRARLVLPDLSGGLHPESPANRPHTAETPRPLHGQPLRRVDPSAAWAAERAVG